MRRISILVLAPSLLSCVVFAGEGPELGGERQKLGYSIGYQVGSDFRQQGLAINPETVLRGVQDALAGSEPQMTPTEMRRTLTELREQATAAEKQQQEREE